MKSLLRCFKKFQILYIKISLKYFKNFKIFEKSSSFERVLELNSRVLELFERVLVLRFDLKFDIKVFL